MLEKLSELLEPALRDLGYDLLHLELQGQGRSAVLRLYIDHLPGQEDELPARDVSLDDCERVSREVSALLDISDPIPHAYRLEVSSPGLDRPLVKPEHFSRFTGHKARVVLHAPIQARRKFVGVLDGVENGQIRMLVDGERVALPWVDIQKARLVPELD